MDRPGCVTLLGRQSRREVVALEGKMESQERYWQGKLSEMRRKHDAEVDCMRRQLQDKDRCAGNRGTPFVVTAVSNKLFDMLESTACDEMCYLTI